jgi:aryl-alcohol dehydrogenase-like predicted oxidoreductase
VATILGEARAAGIDSIDTARAYGASEGVIGEVAPEEIWSVFTKLDPGLASGDVDPGEVSSRAKRSLELSREALRRERLDGVLLHRGDHRLAAGGAAWRALIEEREAGRVGAIGVSAALPDEVRGAIEDPEAEVIQLAASILDRRLVEDGTIARAVELGKRVYVRSVFLQGVLTLAPDALPDHLAGLRESLKRIGSWADERGHSAMEVALAYVRELAGIRVIIGCETATQLVEVLRMWESPAPTAEEVSELVSELPELPADLVTPSLWRGSANR